MKMCPKCKKECKDICKYCTNCGTELTQTIVCPNCNAEYTKKVAFCGKCGTRLLQESEDVKVAENIEISANKTKEQDSKNEEIELKEKPKESKVNETQLPRHEVNNMPPNGGKQMRGQDKFKAFASVVICIIAFVIIFTSSGLIAVRHATSPKVIENTVRDIDVSAIPVDWLWKDSPWQGSTLSEVIYGNVDSYYLLMFGVNENSIEKLLEKSFIKNYLVDKVQNYIDDIYHSTGKGKISVDEIEELLKDNIQSIYKITGYEIIEEDVSNIKAELSLNLTIIDEISVATLREKGHLKWIWVLSYPAIILLVIVAGLLVWAIIAVNRLRKDRLLTHIGASGVVTGIMQLLTSLIVEPLLYTMVPVLTQGKSIISTILSPANSCLQLIGGIITIISAILLAVGLILNKRYKKI